MLGNGLAQPWVNGIDFARRAITLALVDRVTANGHGDCNDARADAHLSAISDTILTAEAATLLAAKLKTPLQIGQHLVRAFEAGFEMGVKPIDDRIVEAILSLQINDLEPQLTRNGCDIRSLVEQFDAKPAEIRQLLRGALGWRR
jgi:hypothetical protein